MYGSKVKVLPVHPVKGAEGNGGKAPLTPNFSTRWKWGVSFTLWLLYLWWKISPLPIGYEVGCPSPTVNTGEEKYPLSLPRVEPRLLRCPGRSLAAVPTALVRLEWTLYKHWINRRVMEVNVRGCFESFTSFRLGLHSISSARHFWQWTLISR